MKNLLTVLLCRLLVAAFCSSSLSSVAEAAPRELDGGGGGADKDLVSSPSTSYACEGSTLTLSCPRPGLVLRVIRANFGRFSVAVCNDDVRANLSVNCMAPRTLRIMQNRCEGRSECKVASLSSVFGSSDPCPGTPKYLEVHYGCFEESEANSRTQPEQFVPPWMTTSTPSPSAAFDIFGLEDLTTAKAAEVTTRPTAAAAAEPEVTTNSGRRVPITAAPTWPALSDHHNDHDLSTDDDKSRISNITARFLSTSLTSTNIMDTSEAPISTVTVKQTTRRRRPSTTFRPSTTLRTTASVTTTTTGTTTTTRAYPTTPETYRPHYLPSSRSPANDILITTHIIDDSHSGGADGKNVKFCSSKIARTLSFPRARGGSLITLSCPLGTKGEARWKCSVEGDEWESPNPDLSGCRSIWLLKIHDQLKRKAASVVHLAKEMSHYTASNPLYGGDILALIDAIGVITEKMLYELPDIPTIEQREAVVMEIVQSVIKTASIMVSESNRAAWMDLQKDSERGRRRTLTHFTRALKDAGLLLPMAVRENQEVTVSSRNILLSVKKLNFHHMSTLRFPSLASKSTKEWTDYHDHADIPSLVLMENMERVVGAENIFIAFKDLNDIFSDEVREKADFSSRKMEKKGVLVNSRIAYVSMQTERRPMVPEPIRITFEHLHRENASESPKCAHWDELRHDWSTAKCGLDWTNETHSECRCFAFGLMALLEDVDLSAAADSGQGIHVTVIVSIIVTTIVVFCLIISFGVGFDYCRKVQMRNKWRSGFHFGHGGARRLPCFQKNNGRNDVANNRNIYVTHSRPQHNFGVNTMPSMEHYMEISPHTGTISARAQAGPQSACSSIRRKSTATVMEYFSHTADHHASPMTSTPTKRPMPPENAILCRNLNSAAHTPLSTPERPLLTDFGGSTQHIYMEVESQRGTLPPRSLILAGSSNHPPPPPPPPPVSGQYQPIQIPILMERITAAESSNSSQSSGYYSEFLQQQQRQQQQQQQNTVLCGPGFDASVRSSSRGVGGVRPKSIGNNFSPAVRVHGGVVNAAMEIQDSQMI